MVYDPGALHVTLSAAVGDDPQLVAELRGAFLDSAATLVDQLKRSRCDGNWRMAALRLQGLGASFGAVALMTVAEAAASGAPGDPVVLREIEHAISMFDA
jgi:HPt (histidine-containing phosphotransfer) domain-containing protein